MKIDSKVRYKIHEPADKDDEISFELKFDE